MHFLYLNTSHAISITSEHLRAVPQFSLLASSTDLGLMFAVGVCFVLLGAVLRHRLRPSAALTPQEAQSRSIHAPEMNPPARKAKPNNENAGPRELQAFLVAKETLTESATSNERH